MDFNKLLLIINKLRLQYSFLINLIAHRSSSIAAPFLNIDGKQQVNVLKYLGIEIDSQLNFKSHINNIQFKIGKEIEILLKIKIKSFHQMPGQCSTML